jgi:hypothetical protein
MKRIVLAVLGVMVFAACGPPPRIYWREMLGKAIYDFTDPLPENNAAKVWIHNMDDKECDKGCQKGVEFGGGGGAASALPSLPSVGGGLGGLFGGGGGSSGGSSGGGGKWDGLAFEVFSNYLTQKRKGKVIEQHHHNYMTESGVSTHKKIEIISESGKFAANFESCEDLCVLDEAKKRRADKILAYQILEMKDDECLIHLRYSDARSGMVEMSRTLKVVGMSITDSSF